MSEVDVRLLWDPRQDLVPNSARDVDRLIRIPNNRKWSLEPRKHPGNCTLYFGYALFDS